MRNRIAAIAVSAFIAAAPAWAVEEHHQPGAASSTPGAPAQAAPAPSGQSSPGMGMGMMGGGMGMMGGQGGMMSCPMMGMMGGQQQGAMSGMMDFAQHVEGHVAFLKAELKITEAQEGSWKPFADALRGLAKTRGMAGGMGMMMGGGAAQQPVALDKTLEQQEQALAAKLEAAKTVRASYAKLAAALSEQQKAAADKLLPSYLRMM